MKKLLWISISFLLAGQSGCATFQNRNKIVILEKKETTVALHSGSSLTVKIPLQTGTGFDWTLDKGKSRLEEISTSMEKPDGEIAGGMAMKIFTLHTTKAMGEDLLTFRLSRSFEKVPPAETRLLNVIIEP